MKGTLVLAAMPAAMGAGLFGEGARLDEWDEHADAVASLVSLTKRRLELGEQVAAAKFWSGQPIEDPDREALVLREVAGRAAEIGLDPEIGTTYFLTQIEASKRLQRRLHAMWRERPDSRPDYSPDLAAEVRPEMDQLTAEILLALKAIDRG
jgi:chorismate mutase